MKLRTKFLLASLVISTGLTAACLLLVRNVLGKQARENVAADLRNSVQTFLNVQHQREAARLRSARLMADLPLVRAVMTTDDPKTIQDASGGLAELSEADLLVLSDRAGKVMALRADTAEFTEQEAAVQMEKSSQVVAKTKWWIGGGRLWEVSTQPIYFGAESEGHLMGHLALGFEIDHRILRELSEVAESEVTFIYGNQGMLSSLPDHQSAELKDRNVLSSGATDMTLDGVHYLVQSLELTKGQNPPVRLVFLKSLDQAMAGMRSLNRLLLVTGLAAVGFGTLLVFLISQTITRPLQDLIAGVRALGRGDYSYPLRGKGTDEFAELTTSFDRMRTDLRSTQRDLLESEKLATIGRMASSISHDLRHHLVAIMANAEFLVEGTRAREEREELYQEVRAGVSEMNELIESLLEFSRTRASLRRTHCRLEDVVRHAAQTARMHPAYHDIPVNVESDPGCEGLFDSKKLERVFHNVLLNAFAATAPNTDPVNVAIRRSGDGVEIRIADHGPGIPEDIRGNIFEPFFSSGKENGTGLGLSVAQKIVADHGGEIVLESSSQAGTVFSIRLQISTAVPA